jgi:hypothetical protein
LLSDVPYIDEQGNKLWLDEGQNWIADDKKVRIAGNYLVVR